MPTVLLLYAAIEAVNSYNGGILTPQVHLTKLWPFPITRIQTSQLSDTTFIKVLQGLVSILITKGNTSLTLCLLYVDKGCIVTCAFLPQALKPSVKVYAAEPSNADDCYQSKLKGELTPNLHPPETIADGVKSSIGLNTWPIIRDLVDDVFTVTEDEIKVRLRHC